MKKKKPQNPDELVYWVAENLFEAMTRPSESEATLNPDARRGYVCVSKAGEILRLSQDELSSRPRVRNRDIADPPEPNKFIATTLRRSVGLAAARRRKRRKKPVQTNLFAQ